MSDLIMVKKEHICPEGEQIFRLIIINISLHVS
jgi:hypothetical protein